jgi:uncharacterized protein HemY
MGLFTGTDIIFLAILVVLIIFYVLGDKNDGLFVSLSIVITIGYKIYIHTSNIKSYYSLIGYVLLIIISTILMIFIFIISIDNLSNYIHGKSKQMPKKKKLSQKTMTAIGFSAQLLELAAEMIYRNKISGARTII